MLSKTPTVPAMTTTFAFISDYSTVRLHRGLGCPACGRLLQAYDIRETDDRIVMICGACGTDLLEIAGV